MAVDAVIIAGYNPNKPDPLAEYAGVTRKATIDMAGQPMIGWVAQALRGSRGVGRLIVVGLGPEDGVDFGEPIDYVPNQRGHLENCITGLKRVLALNPAADQALLVSCDIPLMKPSSVDWLLDIGSKIDADFYYPIIRDITMETTFPGSRRSYIPAKEGRFCGGDIFLVRPALMAANIEKVREIMSQRKNYLAQARIVGLGLLIKALFRQASIADGEAAANRITHARCRAVICPHADLGMDVDKPFQLDMVREVLAGGRR